MASILSVYLSAEPERHLFKYLHPKDRASTFARDFCVRESEADQLLFRGVELEAASAVIFEGC